MKLVLKLIVLVLTASAVAGFVVRPCTVCPSRNPSALAATVDAESGSRTRRGFVTAAVTLGVGAVATLGNNVLPAVAETMDDLAMPTEKEQAAMDEAAMKDRLRRKAELQKQAAAPKGLAESMKAEKEKQGEIKKLSKEERRNALCEELGRGC
jgi:hypothetical protein